MRSCNCKWRRLSCEGLSASLHDYSKQDKKMQWNSLPLHYFLLPLINWLMWTAHPSCQCNNNTADERAAPPTRAMTSLLRCEDRPPARRLAKRSSYVGSDIHQQILRWKRATTGLWSQVVCSLGLVVGSVFKCWRPDLGVKCTFHWINCMELLYISLTDCLIYFSLISIGSLVRWLPLLHNVWLKVER